MLNPIIEFERQCKDAKLRPIAVLEAAGIHRAAWARWKNGKISPTLRSLEAANAALTKLREKSAA